MTDYELFVKDPWLYHIQTGVKTIEGRSGSLEKFAKWIGKKVVFYNNDRKIPVVIKDVRHYNNLYDYLSAEDLKNVLPGVKFYEDAINIYHEFYSDDLIKERGGMNAIVVELYLSQ